jgi:endonuclease/exonuclease/phosphatase (EEP) superfamily protein YafD
MVALILIAHSYTALFSNCMKAAKGDGQSLKIMSYNVWRDNNNMTAVAEVIGREKPDIILLQELQQYNVHRLVKELQFFYHDNEIQIAYASHSLQAIISSYPIQNN